LIFGKIAGQPAQLSCDQAAQGKYDPESKKYYSDNGNSPRDTKALQGSNWRRKHEAE
jgi:hypothetical protein